MALGTIKKRQWYIYMELACLWGALYFEGVLSTACFIGIVISAIMYIFTDEKKELKENIEKEG